jgi:hypothetical protein
MGEKNRDPRDLVLKRDKKLGYLTHAGTGS